IEVERVHDGLLAQLEQTVAGQRLGLVHTEPGEGFLGQRWTRVRAMPFVTDKGQSSLVAVRAQRLGGVQPGHTGADDDNFFQVLPHRGAPFLRISYVLFPQRGSTWPTGSPPPRTSTCNRSWTEETSTPRVRSASSATGVRARISASPSPILTATVSPVGALRTNTPSAPTFDTSPGRRRMRSVSIRSVPETYSGWVLMAVRTACSWLPSGAVRIRNRPRASPTSV